MSEIVQVGGTNYTIPDQGDPPNWGTNLTPFFVALAAEVATAPAFYQGVAVSSTPITVGTEQTYLVASNSITATLNLPAPVQNLWFAVKDSGKNAAVNNITIHRYAAESINGVAADKVLSLSGGWWMFGCDGTNWFMLRDVEALNPFKSTNQLVITPANGATTSTLSFTAPASSRIYTIPDALADCQIVMAAGTQTIAGAKTFSAQVTTADGTANAPSVAIGTGITNKGIYSSGVDSVGLSTGGTVRLNLTTTELRSTVNIVAAGATSNLGSATDSWARLFVGLGANTTPSVTLNTSTGFYSAGANTINFTTNGTARMSLDTTSLTCNLPFYAADGTTSAPGYGFGSHSNYGLYLNGTTLTLTTAGTDRYYFDGTAIQPGATNTYDIGQASLKFKNLYATGVVGTTTTDNAAAGNVGEYIESIVASFANTPVSGSAGDITSISLTSGDWDVMVVAEVTANGATWSRADIGIGTSSGNVSPIGDTRQQQSWTNSSTVPTQVTGTSFYRAQVSGTVPYYLKIVSTYSAGQPQARGKICARRRR